jgi:hypothetical protein
VERGEADSGCLGRRGKVGLLIDIDGGDYCPRLEGDAPLFDHCSGDCSGAISMRLENCWKVPRAGHLLTVVLTGWN